MSWNLEVAAARTEDLDEVIPDVFEPTSTTMGFEEATSVQRAPALCAARIGPWAVVIDVGCRLSQNPEYLAETSSSTDLHVVRIADDPILLHYRDGRQVPTARGLAVAPTPPHERGDGETEAIGHLREATGLSFGAAPWWNARFRLYLL